MEGAVEKGQASVVSFSRFDLCNVKVGGWGYDGKSRCSYSDCQ